MIPAERRQHLSRLGLGTSRMGSFGNAQHPRESIRLVRGALDLGVTTIDTANIYGQGDSERTIGRALAGVRDQAFIITKGGRLFSARTRALLWAKPVIRTLLARRSSGQAVTARRGEELRTDWRGPSFAVSLDHSLRRLRTDRVDAFLLHSPPAAVAGDPAVHAALVALRDAGKAGQVGMSCDDREALAAALTMPALTMLELPVDLLADAGGFAAEIAARGIVVVAREAIRLCPQRTPVEAVRDTLAHPQVSCTVIGTTRLAHLADIARHST